MNARSVFLKGIRDIQRIFRLHTFKRLLENAALIFLCLYTISSLMHWFGLTMLRVPGFLYLAIGLSLMGAAVLAWSGRKPLYSRLIEIDTAFNLQDRISTAYEYLHKGKETGLFDLLIRDAGQKISEIDKKKIFPRKPTWIHILLGLLILTNLLMAAFKNPFVIEAPDAVDPATLDKIRLAIKQYSSSPSGKESQPKEILSDRVKTRMTGLSNMLENPPIHRERLSEMVHNALKTIQSDKIARARDLVKELGLDAIEEVAVQQIQQAGTLTHFQLKKLNELLKRMFEDQIPEAVVEDLAVLDEHHRLEAYLDQILDELEKGSVRQSAPKDETADGAERSASGEDTASKNRSDLKEQGSSAKGSDANRRASTAATDRASSGKDGLQEEMEEGENGTGPSSAGLAKSEAPSGSPYEPDRLRGSAVQDKTASAEGAEISVLIRSLTAIGKAKVEKQQIVRDYQQAVESVLQKEGIPLNYKSYIRNYFLSIGLRKEPSSSDRIQ